MKKVVAMNSPDLIIIGGGSSAFAAARLATGMGKHVTLISDDTLPIGGTCLNVGCVPSKTLIRTAEKIYKANHHQLAGIKSSAKVTDFKAIIQQKRDIIAKLRKEKYSDAALKMPNLTLVKGRAVFKDKRTVIVNDTELSAENFIIATGSRTYAPDVKGLSDTPYLTNVTAFELDKLPKSLIILGGGYIALETAQLFSRLGSKVTILQRSNQILSHESKDIADTIHGYLEDEGIQVVTGVTLQEVSGDQSHITVKSKTKTFTSEKLFLERCFLNNHLPA